MTDALGVMQLFETIIERREVVFCNYFMMLSAILKRCLNTGYLFPFYFISHCNLKFVSGNRAFNLMRKIMINNIVETE
jgi:hypothetical protein